MMNKMTCPICGKILINLIKYDEYVAHFWCDECRIDINIEKECDEPIDTDGELGYNEDEGFDPYIGSYTFDC